MKQTNRHFLIFIVTVIMTVSALFAIQRINGYTYDTKHHVLDSNWAFTKDDKTYHDITLSSFSIPDGVKMGDVLVIRTTLPDTLYTDPMLCFRVYLCAIQVFVDNEEIYSRGMDDFRNGKLTGSDYSFVRLPQDSAGKELTIRFYVSADNAISTIGTIELDEAGNTTKNFISTRLASIFSSIFLLVFGSILLFIAIILVVARSKDFMSIVYVALFAIIVGLWFSCKDGYIIFLSENLTSNRIMEYFTLYCFPIPIMLFLSSIRKETFKLNNRINVPFAIAIVSALMIFLTILLHATGIVNYTAMLSLYHIMFVFDIAYCIMSCIIQIRKGARISEKFILFGIFLMGILFGTDILLFNADKYISPFFRKFEGLCSFGAVGFIFCMIFSFGLDIYNAMAKNMEREALEKLAYSDQLTKLANRAKYTEVLNEILSRQNNFTMINFDINDLKLNNDTKGHACGDQLLCAFASVIRDTFSNYGVVCRTGGDEFNVLLENSDRELLNRLMNDYSHRLYEENHKCYPFVISAAWGVAFSDEENNLSPAEISILADKRMYTMKKQMKKSC